MPLHTSYMDKLGWYSQKPVHAPTYIAKKGQEVSQRVCFCFGIRIALLLLYIYLFAANVQQQKKYLDIFTYNIFTFYVSPDIPT